MAIQDTAKNIASLGRYGDTTLVHMQPNEVAGLQQLAKANGTSLTTNPQTGMPEAFSLKGFLPMIAGGALAAAGLSPLMAGMMVGGATAVAEKDLGAGLMAGLGAGSGGSLFNSFASAAPSTVAAPVTAGVEGVAAAAPTFDVASQGLMGVDPLASQGFASAGGNQLGAVGPNMGQVNTAFDVRAATPQFGTPAPATNTSMMQNANIRQPSPNSFGGPNMNQVNPVSPRAPTNTNTSMMQNARITEPNSLGQKFDTFTGNVTENFNTNTENAGRGFSDFFEEGGIDRFAARNGAQPTRVNNYAADGTLESYTTTPGEPLSNFEVAGKIGMPIGGGILGGIEESDLYAPFDASPYKEDNRFRGPENQLNLAGMSTLNLNNPYGRSPSSSSTSAGILGLDNGGYLGGGNIMGDGMSDDIPATIGGTQEARLSEGEFVIPADVVSHMGNGSSEAGAKHFYAMMDRVRKDRTGTESQGKEINPERYMST